MVPSQFGLCSDLLKSNTFTTSLKSSSSLGCWTRDRSEQRFCDFAIENSLSSLTGYASLIPSYHNFRPSRFSIPNLIRRKWETKPSAPLLHLCWQACFMPWSLILYLVNVIHTTTLTLYSRSEYLVWFPFLTKKAHSTKYEKIQIFLSTENTELTEEWSTLRKHKILLIGLLDSTHNRFTSRWFGPSVIIEI